MATIRAQGLLSPLLATGLGIYQRQGTRESRAPRRSPRCGLRTRRVASLLGRLGCSRGARLGGRTHGAQLAAMEREPREPQEQR